MNNDLFLSIEGITGESADANHKGWIDIDSIVWGASQTGNIHSGGVGERIGLNYQFQAAKVRTHYWEQSASGGKGPESASGWNIKENRSY